LFIHYNSSLLLNKQSELNDFNSQNERKSDPSLMRINYNKLSRKADINEEILRNRYQISMNVLETENQAIRWDRITYIAYFYLILLIEELLLGVLKLLSIPKYFIIKF